MGKLVRGAFLQFLLSLAQGEEEVYVFVVESAAGVAVHQLGLEGGLGLASGDEETHLVFRGFFSPNRVKRLG